MIKKGIRFFREIGMMDKIIVIVIFVLAIVGTIETTKFIHGKVGSPITGFAAADDSAGTSICEDQCTDVFCKDGNILVECADTDGDGCKEMSETICKYSCTDRKCVDTQEEFTITTGDVITQFPAKIKIETINADGTVTMTVGDDIAIFSKGDVKLIKGLSIAMIAIGTDSVSIKVKQA